MSATKEWLRMEHIPLYFRATLGLTVTQVHPGVTTYTSLRCLSRLLTHAKTQAVSTRLKMKGGMTLQQLSVSVECLALIWRLDFNP